MSDEGAGCYHCEDSLNNCRAGRLRDCLSAGGKSMFLLFSKGQEEVLRELKTDQLYLDPPEGWVVMEQLILGTLLGHIKGSD